MLHPMREAAATIVSIFL